MHLIAGGALVAVKSRAMNQLTKLKNSLYSQKERTNAAADDSNTRNYKPTNRKCGRPRT
jgi:hypothetical protein